jgi:AcrR family transcriptional regulator
MPVPGSSDERSALLRAAWAVVRRSGFEGFKVQLVLRETGLSARTFYRHFADKEHVFLALTLEEYAGTARRLARATADAGPEPESRVRAWITELLLGAGDPERLPRTRLFSAHHTIMSRFPAELAQANALLLEPLLEAIKTGQQGGVFTSDDPSGDAEHVADLVSGALTRSVVRPVGHSEMPALVESTAQFALRALRGAVPSRPMPGPRDEREALAQGPAHGGISCPVADRRAGTAPRRRRG